MISKLNKIANRLNAFTHNYILLVQLCIYYSLLILFRLVD
uniref:Uncharacterized protein n=1 Tax=Rhizophora mucronata TaxID=61149 RepID=A0A2P2QQ07_RHIMU